MSEKKTFDGVFWLDMLRKVAASNVSDRVMATQLMTEFRAFVSEADHTEVAVWNFCKWAMDHICCFASASSFYQVMLDLERFNHAPVGAYCERDGNMDEAPWRKGHELMGSWR